MDKRTSTAPAGWARGVSGIFTLDGEAVALDELGPLSMADRDAIGRLPVGALLELDADVPGSESLLRRVG